jgi:hypothetical protein
MFMIDLCLFYVSFLIPCVASLALSDTALISSSIYFLDSDLACLFIL